MVGRRAAVPLVAGSLLTGSEVGSPPEVGSGFAYMTAFERATLPEEAFGDRVRELGLKAKTLRAHQAELEQFPDPGDDTELTLAGLELMYRYLKRIIERPRDDIRKNVAQALVHDLHVDDPTHVTPTYRIIVPPPGSWPQSPLDGNDEASVRAMTSLVVLRCRYADSAELRDQLSRLVELLR
ncbi:MAG: hypothetical protein ACRDVP_11060 [Acidimicrobiales bacterium]